MHDLVELLRDDCYYVAAKKVEQMQTEIERLRAETEHLREALQFIGKNIPKLTVEEIMRFAKTAGKKK